MATNLYKKILIKKDLILIIGTACSSSVLKDFLIIKWCIL